MMSKWKSFSIVIVLCMSLMLITSCASERVVTVPEIHEVTTIKRDTVAQHDSIYMSDFVYLDSRGDTFIQKEYHTLYRDRWRYKLVVDSFQQRDTVNVIQEVEKPPSKMDAFKILFGDLAFFLLVSLSIVIGCLYKIKHSRG